MPHLSVKDINAVDWARLRRAGCQGVVFDKARAMLRGDALCGEALLCSNSCAQS